MADAYESRRRTASQLARRCAGLLALFALLTLACDGGEGPVAPSPVATATATPAATPTVATATPSPAATPASTATTVATATPTATPSATATPTATATPSPTPTPTPATAPTEVATTTAVATTPASAAGHAVASDRAALVALYEATGGANWRNSTNWLTSRPLREWYGVGTSRTGRVTELGLDENGLSGSLPAELGELSRLEYLYLNDNELSGAIPVELGTLVNLRALWLQNNELTGCVPRALRLVTRNDFGTLGLESCALPSTTLSYDSYDTTGAVATAGSYAFLMPSGDSTAVVTTYEQLRTESTALRVNLTDAAGASRAAFYDNVLEGDVVEWRQADDCWARYVVTALPAAVAGAVTREFTVKAYTDAYTGCSGAVVAAGDRAIGWSPPAISSHNLRSPVRHGSVHLLPGGGWADHYAAPVIAPVPDHVAAVRDHRGGPHPFWRPATVPEGWTLHGVTWGGETDPAYGYTAWYVNEQGEPGVEILVGHVGGEQYPYPVAVGSTPVWVRELSIIDGHHAIVQYSPPGPNHEPDRLPRVDLYSEETGMFYLVIAWDWSLAGSDPSVTIEIARSLLPETDAP